MVHSDKNFDVCDVAACVIVAQSFGDMCACGVFARAVFFSCIGRGPVPVNRELHVHCALCVHVRGATCGGLCVCRVFFCVRWLEVYGALGMSMSVENWSWRCLCGCACVSGLILVGGRCIRRMVVVASAKCSACRSVFLLSTCHDREVATHSSCSAKSSHIVRDTGARVEGWHYLLTSTMVPTRSSSVQVQ